MMKSNLVYLAVSADGLTKILPKQKFAEFVRHLGLIDITERLNGLR